MTTLYRLLDDNLRLLYVGIASNPGRRFEQHAVDKPWWSEVAHVRTEHFDTRADALRAEKRAIQDEKPLHNVVHNNKPRLGDPMATSNGEQRSDNARMDRAAKTPLSPDSLVGSFFHSDAERGWQGCVVAEPTPGIYLVETYSWLTGSGYEQCLVRIEDMLGWHFYDTPDWMINAYDSGLDRRWERERVEAAGTGTEKQP